MTGFNAKKMAVAGGCLILGLCLSTPGYAIQTAAQFLASLDEIKPICRKLEEPFWRSKYYYGCGDAYKCAMKSGVCNAVYERPKKPKRPNYPPLTHVADKNHGAEKQDSPGGKTGKSGKGGESPGLQ